ncbi:MAG TPA: hypothetical protein DF383_10105, partial [Deltaproteobacteria bacterium]|nr:hypothetical protein [Deltaproteobacteria bacterium]
MKNGGKDKKTPGSFDLIRFLEVCRLLNEQGAEYLVVGGFACNLHGLIRATRDIDLLIPRDVANTEKVLAALRDLTFGFAGELDAEEIVR